MQDSKHNLCLSTIHTAGPSVWALVSSLCLNPSVWGSRVLAPLYHRICFSRSLEQEISFDFGPHGEFAYLYSQCYELTTNEYILALVGGGVGRGKIQGRRALGEQEL